MRVLRYLILYFLTIGVIKLIVGIIGLAIERKNK